MLIAIVVVFVLLMPRACERYPRADAAAMPATVAALPAQTADQRFALDRFGDVAAAALPAVVRIENRAARAVPTTRMPGFFGPQPGAPDPAPRVTGGSGFIIASDGKILTNAHVVQGGELTVWLDDRRSFPAALPGLDLTTDVAVLDIEATNRPTLPLGDSQELRVGDWLLAIGSPGVGGGQLEQTVTAGMVIAMGRPLQLLGPGLLQDPRTAEFAGYAIENFIQTDAAINPGNSGGPLVDMNGGVIGINTAIASPTGYDLGYGFAVPINLASGVADDIIEFGEVRRARLGVNVTTVTPRWISASSGTASR
ncbi:MAG: trypsin-like peptidase domain-containing protein [Gemmatimonadota bacterium]